MWLHLAISPGDKFRARGNLLSQGYLLTFRLLNAVLPSFRFGNTGDANALQRLAEAEKTLKEEFAPISRDLVTPNVGPKQPTSEGPKFTR